MLATKRDKIRFVREHTASVVKRLIESADKWPEHWDGHELRRLMADYYEESARISAPMENKRASRRRDYENARITLGF